MFFYARKLTTLFTGRGLFMKRKRSDDKTSRVTLTSVSLFSTMNKAPKKPRIKPSKSLKAPKLNLTKDERTRLTGAKIKLVEIQSFTPETLSRATGIPPKRCDHLIALSQFQTLDSIGPSIAEDIYLLGYRRSRELRSADPAEMFSQITRMAGGYMDPCVEDTFRAAVAQVKYPDLLPEQKQWWLWMHDRGKHTVDRPAKPLTETAASTSAAAGSRGAGAPDTEDRASKLEVSRRPSR